MRYKAKHNFFKQQLKSLKNITMTLAKKHQSYMGMNHKSFSKEILIVGPGKMGTLYELKQGAAIAAKFGNVLSTSVFSAKWIKYRGTEYHCDFIVCADVACEMPVFCKNDMIAVKDWLGFALWKIDGNHVFW